MKDPQTIDETDKRIIRLMAEGLSTKQIAERLGFTEPTTETYRTRLLKKFNVSNGPQLIAVAFHTGILTTQR